MTYDNIGEAIRQINSLMQEAKNRGLNVLGTDVGEHLYPGDVYDAYLAFERKASIEHMLEQDECGPFAAVFLHRFPSANPSAWRAYVVQTFDSRYVAGFCDGFRLAVPECTEEGDVHYLRGVYEGVMAHAAVF